MKKWLEKFETKVVVASGLITFTVLCILFYIKGLAPFGTKSLAVMDAGIQYLDFFAYLKDVFAGKNSIAYTFGKTLGGSNIAVFSYYLTSPFNLLLVFFSKTQLNSFFSIVVILKLTLASVAFAYFGVRRFERMKNESACVYIIMAVGYGLCQYNMSQSSNIMWLDGVYMLPFLLLQVYYIVQGKKTWTLSFLVGVTILFNWYSAGIDCIFTAAWFLVEFCLMVIEKKPDIKTSIYRLLRYGFSMIFGVMLSAAIFLPTIGALKKSSRGSLHFNDLMEFFAGWRTSICNSKIYVWIGQ